VSPNPIKLTREFERVKSRLSGMSPARSMQQIQRDYERTGGRSGNDPMSGGRYSRRVERPSVQMRTYSNSGLSLRVPDNWREFSTNSQVAFAPEGGFGDQGITHGVMLGVEQTNSRDVYQATQDYIDSLLQSNTYLRQQGTINRTTQAGRAGNVVPLSGRSSVTGETEVVTVYTTILSNGVLVYLATVSPQSEAYQYDSTFRSVVDSLRLNN
jgi:hypothetical protein